MSYILEALKKSEQQRRRGTVPTLAAVVSLPGPPPRRELPFYGLMGTLLVVGIAIGAVQPWKRKAPEPPAAGPAVTAPLTPNFSPGLSPKGKEEAIPLPRPLGEGNGPSALLQDSGRHASVPVRPAATSRAPAPHPAGAAPSPATAAVTVTAPLPPTRPPSRIARLELPPMSIAVHAYSSKPRDRLVSVNDRLLREGDSLAPDLKLEEITPDGMIFNYRGNRIERTAR